MSYPPFTPAYGKHPHPPNLSYPSAPPTTSSQYPPAPYPPGGVNFPNPSNSPYPPSSSPYPPSGSPYPPSSAPYPPSGSPYPPSGSPYPPSGSPYPPSGSPYPPSGSPYPPPSSPYPPSSAPYPPSGSPYPPSSALYPPSGSPYHPVGGGYNRGYSSPYLSTQTPYSSQEGSDPVHSPVYPTSAPTLLSSKRPPYPSQHSTSSPGNRQEHPPQKTNPTIRPVTPFYPRQDAEILRKAMKGFGTDETTIISVLTKRTNFQRQDIAKEFKTLYGKDLVKDLKSETRGHFEDVLVALMTPLTEYYAKELNHAISGIGTTESTIIEVLCSLTNSEIQYVKMAYQSLFHQSLEHDLASDTSGNFKRLLVSLCQGARDESPHVDPTGAMQDAQALLRAGELRFGTDESTFNAILCSRSYAQLQAVFNEYEKLTGHSLEKAIKNEFSGDIEDGLLAIVKCVRNRSDFFAECLYNSMAGMGTRDRDLIRLVVTRSEIDLEDVKQAFNAKYGKSLESFVKGDTSGDYKKCLLAVIEGN